MTNLKTLFDAVTGGIDGSAGVEGWEKMSAEKLYEQIDAQNEYFYDFKISHEDKLLIAKAVFAAQNLNDLSFKEIRNSL